MGALPCLIYVDRVAEFVTHEYVFDFHDGRCVIVNLDSASGGDIAINY
jgi:hypothetical protein